MQINQSKIYPNGKVRDKELYIPGVKKIAVLRSNALGDFIFTLPALEALRATYPEAEIVLLGLDWHAQFLKGRSGPVDRVEVVPQVRSLLEGPDKVDDPGELERFFERMVAEEFDIAIQMYGGGRYSNPFIKRMGASLTAGLRTPDAIQLDRWVHYELFQHEVLRYLEVVALVGAKPVGLKPRLEVKGSDLEEIKQLIHIEGRPIAVLHPGATDPRRRWPVEKFAAVGEALSSIGARVVVIGTKPEQDLAAGVVEEMEAEALNFCERLSLGGLAGLLSQARVVVSNDTGPLHLAAAVGAATVGIYWCGNVITAGPISHHRHRVAISWRLECPICGMDCIRSDCGHRATFVSEGSEEEVKDAAFALLSLNESPIQRSLQVKV
jgi:ADP-heptose:LPS heptosyltransferase